MPHLAWTEEAIADLARIRDFLKPVDPKLAGRAVSTIRQRLKVLKSYREAGRPVGILGHREWLVPFGASRYIVLYQNRADAIVIVAVRHHREVDFPSHDS